MSGSLVSAGKRGDAQELQRMLLSTHHNGDNGDNGDNGGESSGVCDVNERDAAGRSALHEAAAGGHLEALRLLLVHHADPNAQDAYMQTPLMLAAEHDHSEAVNELCSNGGIDMRAQDLFHRTALHWAAHNGNLEAVAQLISAGADVNQQTTSGETALHWACSSPRVPSEQTRQQLVQYLVEHGANVLANNSAHQRPAALLSEDAPANIRRFLQAKATQQQEEEEQKTDLQATATAIATAPAPVVARLKPKPAMGAKKLKITLKK